MAVTDDSDGGTHYEGDTFREPTQREKDRGLDIFDFSWPPGDPRRFGAVLDGVTDDTERLQIWASLGGKLRFPLDAVAFISGSIELVSNTTLIMAEGATIRSSTPNMHFFSAAGKSNILIRGGKLQHTAPGTEPYYSGVYLLNCDHCRVFETEFENMQWSSVYLDSSHHCEVAHCYMRGTPGQAGDTSDVCVYRNSSYNLIHHNRMYGLGHVGCLVQDPNGTGAYLPLKNKVNNNFVGRKTVYGLVVYIGGTVETYNEMNGNDVEDITAEDYTDGGAGIYAVGSGIGGLKIINNSVRNCCQKTLSRLNAPGAIVVSDVPQGGIRPIIANNTIEGMVQGDGILIATCPGGAVLSDNVVRMPSTNNGTGPGGGTLAGNAIRIQNSSNVSVAGGQLIHNGPQDALLGLATSGNHSSITINGVGAVTQTGNPFRFDRESGFSYTSVTISGCTGETASNSPNVMQLSGVDRLSVTGNTGSCGSQPALNVANCTNARFANNSFNSSGSIGVSTSGTCTGSYYDKSNHHVGVINNSATGFLAESFGTAAPTTGTGAVGDRVQNSSSVAGQPKGWRCTSAGSPGTWTSEGNL